MKLSRLFPLLFPFFLTCGLSGAQTQNETQALKEENVTHQTTPLKAIHTENMSYPEEARKKGVEGKVTLSIVVDESGRVAEAKALSGPRELQQAAIDSVKQWEFEPPTHPPVETRVEIAYGHPKECPGPVSDAGEVSSGGLLRSRKGTVVSADFDIHQPLPPYFMEDRKAGVTGVMILSVTLSPDGRVTRVHVVKSLSPHLNKAAVKTVRQWRFKLIKGNPDAMTDDFELPILFRATCRMQF